MRLCLFAVAFILFSEAVLAQVGSVGSPQQSPYCAVPKVKSYMDIILDPMNKKYEVFVYNLSTGYKKTGIDGALVYVANLSNLSNIKVCYDVTNAEGRVSFPYDPNAEGCTDLWVIFCPHYSGGGGTPTFSDKEACLNGTALPPSSWAAVGRCSASASVPKDYRFVYLPSHNTLYFCNNPPKDFALLCWPVMLIFALLVGASYAIGRNPFQAFDVSAPRMGRGRQYTPRVQQKSFDLMTYVGGGLSTAAEATEKMIGAEKGTIAQYTPLNLIGKGVATVSGKVTEWGKKALDKVFKKDSKKGGDKVDIPASKKPALQKPGAADGKKKPEAPSSQPSIADAKKIGQDVLGLVPMVGTVGGAVQAPSKGGAQRGKGGKDSGAPQAPSKDGGRLQAVPTMGTQANIYSSMNVLAGAPNLRDVVEMFSGSSKASPNGTTVRAPPGTLERLAFAAGLESIGKEGGGFGKQLLAVMGFIVKQLLGGLPTFRNIFKLEGESKGEQVRDFFGELIDNVLSIHSFLTQLSFRTKSWSALLGKKIGVLSWVDRLNEKSVFSFSFSLPIKIGGTRLDRFLGPIRVGADVGTVSGLMGGSGNVPYGLEPFRRAFSDIKSLADYALAVKPSSEAFMTAEKNGVVIAVGMDGRAQFYDKENREFMSREEAIKKMGFEDGGEAFKKFIDGGEVPFSPLKDRSLMSVLTAFGFKTGFGKIGKDGFEEISESSYVAALKENAIYESKNAEIVKVLLSNSAARLGGNEKELQELAEKRRIYDNAQAKKEGGGLSLEGLEILIRNYGEDNKNVIDALNELKLLGVITKDYKLEIERGGKKFLNEKDRKKLLNEIESFRKDSREASEIIREYTALNQQYAALTNKITAFDQMAQIMKDKPEGMADKIKEYQVLLRASDESETLAKMQYQVGFENSTKGVFGRLEEWIMSDKQGQERILSEEKAKLEEYNKMFEKTKYEEDPVAYQSLLIAKMRSEIIVNTLEGWTTKKDYTPEARAKAISAIYYANKKVEDDVSILSKASYEATSLLYALVKKELVEGANDYLSSLRDVIRNAGTFGSGNIEKNLAPFIRPLEKLNVEANREIGPGEEEMHKKKIGIMLSLGNKYNSEKDEKKREVLDKTLDIVFLTPHTKLDKKIDGLPSMEEVASDPQKYVVLLDKLNVEARVLAFEDLKEKILARSSMGEYEGSPLSLKKDGGDATGEWTRLIDKATNYIKGKLEEIGKM
ncbi:MAG: hypothetical protein N3G22_03935, partial [Candidatus Micrarchaeota archaeon]|nr:hypothetical protein [Candidatus Micrarchaeota archaeon]